MTLLLTPLSLLSYNAERLRGNRIFNHRKHSMHIAKDRFPLRLERRYRGNLAGQVADVLRGALVTGFYKPGDVLPTIRELAEKLEVGRVNVERAVSRLTDEGLLNPRPGIGCVVCDAGVTLWKGRVLVVVPPGTGSMADIPMSTVIRDFLTLNGYLTHVVTVDRTPEGRFDFALLDLMTRQKTDLVVQLHDKPEISGWLSSRKLPFVRCTSGGAQERPPACVGTVRRSNAAAMTVFAEHCAGEGVRNVLIAAAWDVRDVAESLRKAGISSRIWRVPIPPGTTGTEVSRLALEAMTERLSGHGRCDFPELVYFDDDYLASGALTAMLYAGVKIPEDVHVVTVVNPVGSGLVFPVPLTRLEMNTPDWGRSVAEHVLGYLKTGEFPEDAVIGPEYVRGGTF